MKIAYVTINVAPNIMSGGVGAKIKRHTALWKEMGYAVQIFSLTPEIVPIPDSEQFVYKPLTRMFLFKFLTLEASRSWTLNRMIAAVREYHPDVIYLRFGLYTFPLYKLFKIAPVVLEINSDDRVEYSTRGACFYWMNRLTRGLTFAPACGIITPSHELVSVLLPKRNKPVCVISNGIDLKDVETLTATTHVKPVLTLVGSPGMNWHGVDKLIRFAEKCPDVVVNIVGYSPGDVESTIPGNMYLHGFLNRSQLREVYITTDVACGTLALHRKGMEEACPLKVREAIAYGIPVIIAYRDTDLSEVALDTILRIPNTEDNVVQNAERIRKFAYNMIGRRVDINSVAPYLDQEQKETIRLAFIEKILKGHGLE